MKKLSLALAALLLMASLLLAGCSKGADSYQDKYAPAQEVPEASVEESAPAGGIVLDEYRPPSSVIEEESSIFH